MLLRVSALLAGVLFASSATAQDRRDYYCSSETPQDWARINSAWMSKLPDGVKLSALSIPGTHDTCALYGGDLIQTQAWSLANQFAVGIRFVDIRCRHIGNGFAIHHDLKYQNINFDDVLKACQKFLAENPKECIIMSVKEEYDPTNNTRSFADTFNQGYLAGREQLIYTQKVIPTLGEVRGKIVLVARAEGIGGIPWSDLDKQDDFTVPTMLHIPQKFDKVVAKIRDANAGDPGKWFVNFSSGTSSGCYPYTVARGVNEGLYELLSKNRPTRIGTIVMDYPGEKLIDQIINVNFGATNYTLSIVTGDRSGAGTDANIFVTITGKNGATAEQRLNGLISGDAFERNTTNTCELKGLKDVGEITSITVRSDNSYAGSAWFLGHVDVTAAGKAPVRFSCNNWLETGTLTRTLSP